MKLFVGFISFIVIFIAAIFVYNRIDQPAPLGTEFRLIDSDGHVVTEKDIRAKPSIVFFGYTMCPDICPTTLFDIHNWLQKLKPEEVDKLGIWFFSVDPEHDTPQVMHEYLSNISNKIKGVSGDPKEMQRVIKSFNIVATKVPGEHGEYTYDHTAAVLLLYKGGRLASIVPYRPNVGSESEREGQALDKIRNILNHS